MIFTRIGDNAETKLIIRNQNETLLAVKYGDEVSSEKHLVALGKVSEFIEQYGAQLDDTQLRIAREARTICKYFSVPFCSITQGPSLARELRGL